MDTADRGKMVLILKAAFAKLAGIDDSHGVLHSIESLSLGIR